jgi:hypothetical protein
MSTLSPISALLIVVLAAAGPAEDELAPEEGANRQLMIGFLLTL